MKCEAGDDTDVAFATIAENNGYRSRTSCSQTFKRIFGHPPDDLRNYSNPDFGSQYEDGVSDARSS
jgi:AraC-like DNA-binding protein